MASRSISSRLTIWFSAVFFAGLLLFGTLMWFTLRHTLIDGRMRTLERRADRLSELLRETALGEERGPRLQSFAEATGGGLIEILRPDGGLAFPRPASAAEFFPWPRFANLSKEDSRETNFMGQPYLVLARPFQDYSGTLILCIAAPLEGNRTILRAFSEGLLWTVPGLLALSALGGYILSRRALRPVDDITAATRSISVSNLSERLPVPQTHDELQRLTETCNAMLGRLELAVNEIRRFTADASHELRSPVSFIRTVAEVALRDRRGDPYGAFEEIVEECGKTSRLLEDLLTLARADTGNDRLAFETVDLVELVRSVCEKAYLMATPLQRTVALSIHSVAHASVNGDYCSLRRLLWILLDNAMKYSPEQSQIAVSITATAGQAVIAVEDHGIGISALDLPRIFERFYRADPSRGDVEGSGLGLAIAKWIAEIHGARILVESQENQGSVFRLVFPLAFSGSNSERKTITDSTLPRNASPIPWPILKV